MKYVPSKIILLILYMHSGSQAQSFSGIGSSTYGGVQNVIYNPALMLSSPQKVDINVISGYSVLGSDYSYVDLGDGINLTKGFEFGNNDASSKSNNNFYRYADVVGPSVIYSINRENSVAIITRARGIFNINNLSGKLLENIDSNFNIDEDFSNTTDNFSGTIHAWGEIGIAYAYSFNRVNQSISLGATVKYLRGAGSIHLASSNLNHTYNLEEKTLTTDGNLIYGSTDDFDSGDINFDSSTGGFAFDLGMVINYEQVDFLRGNSFKMGISIHDIGRIKYRYTETVAYDLNKSLAPGVFGGDTPIKKILDENYEKETDTISQKIKLPSTSHLFVDLEISERVFLGLESSISLRRKKRGKTNRIYNYFTINPRWETKRISIYNPITLQQHTGLNWGFGFRVGYAVIGSSALLSNVLTSSKINDVYVGLTIPIYK